MVLFQAPRALVRICGFGPHGWWVSAELITPHLEFKWPKKPCVECKGHMSSFHIHSRMRWISQPAGALFWNWLWGESGITHQEASLGYCRCLTWVSWTLTLTTSVLSKTQWGELSSTLSRPSGSYPEVKWLKKLWALASRETYFAVLLLFFFFFSFLEVITHLHEC